MITPNRLTFVRMAIAVSLPALLLCHRSLLSEGIAIVAFTVACVTDWWDGHLARTKLMVTTVGKIVDPIADKALIIGCLLVFWIYGLFSIVWIILILIREIAVTFARLIRLIKGEVIPAEWAGKIKLGFQIGSVYSLFIFLLLADSAFPHTSFGPIGLSLSRALYFFALFITNVITAFSGGLFFYRLMKP